LLLESFNGSPEDTFAATSTISKWVEKSDRSLFKCKERNSFSKYYFKLRVGDGGIWICFLLENSCLPGLGGGIYI
jgi:hypothetical protein